MRAAGSRDEPDPSPLPVADATCRRAVTAPAPTTGQVSVVVPTHDDAGTIGLLVRCLLDEPEVGEVLVVASGCRDGTIDEVLAAAGTDGRVGLWEEQERSGKIPAVNLGFQEARGGLVALVSGDVLPEPGVIGKLVEAVAPDGVGMSGGRPVPRRRPGLVGHAVSLLWELHHLGALRQPKLGELVVLKAEACPGIGMTMVDEATFQAAVEAYGWRCVYVPEAVVHNRGPETAAHFVERRRRCHAGHLLLRQRQGYSVPSLHPATVASDLLRLLASDSALWTPAALVRTGGTVILEATARLLARFDYLLGKEAHVWKVVESAKAPLGSTDGIVSGSGERVATVGLAPPPAHQRHG